MGCVSSRSFLCRIFGGLLDAKTFYLQKITNKIHDIVSFGNNMAISAHGTLCLLRQQGVLASDLSLLRSRLHRRSGVAAGVGGGAVCLLFSPKSHRLALFLLVYGFLLFLSGSLSVNSIWLCFTGLQSLT